MPTPTPSPSPTPDTPCRPPTPPPDDNPLPLIEFIERYRPLVRSVCLRYLRRPEDLDDAEQETFSRLVRHIGRLHASGGTVASWLTITARSVCAEFIRKAIRERRRRQGLATALPTLLQKQVSHEAIERHLGRALLALDAASRELVIERFYQRLPLRALAVSRNISVATVSRHATGALRELAAVLRSMGVESVDDLSLAEHFGDPALLGAPQSDDPESLRFAPDWQTLNTSPLALPAQRPIRIGAFVSHLSASTLDFRGMYHTMEEQVWSTRLLSDPAFDLVAIAEPDTTDKPSVERTLREYELTAGLISADDPEALKTLDVILLGINYRIQPAVARAFRLAVESGVGLLNEFWTAMVTLPEQAAQDVQALMLSATPCYGHHEPPTCGTPIPATVTSEHPLLPGLKPGTQLSLSGCGPVFQPLPHAHVPLLKNRLIPPNVHRIEGLGPAQMPVFLTGTLGKGRIVWTGLWRHDALTTHLSITPHQYLRNIITYLAKPQSHPSP